MSGSTKRFEVEIQERLAFQERALEQLNRVVAEQQLELDTLQREVAEFRKQAARQSAAPSDGSSADVDGPNRSLEDDRPPHY